MANIAQFSIRAQPQTLCTGRRQTITFQIKNESEQRWQGIIFTIRDLRVIVSPKSVGHRCLLPGDTWSQDIEMELVEDLPQLAVPFTLGWREEAGRPEKHQGIVDFVVESTSASRLNDVLDDTSAHSSQRTRHIGPSPGAASAEPLGPIRNRWALLVGVNRYVEPGFPLLKFCVEDVLALEGTLSAQGYTVVVLHDDTTEERLLPTRENVEAELARLCQAAQRDDLLWVHLSCHGRLVNGQPVLITQETRAPTLAEKALPLAEVERRMRGSSVRRLVLTLDACHTGVEIGRDLADPAFIHNVYECAEGFVLIAASTSQQIAQEWKEKQHGVFTYYVLEGLSGKADRMRKGFVTVNDLVTHTLDGLRRWNVEHGGLLQEPTARMEGLGDLILSDYREKDE